MGCARTPSLGRFPGSSLSTLLSCTASHPCNDYALSVATLWRLFSALSPPFFSAACARWPCPYRQRRLPQRRRSTLDSQRRLSTLDSEAAVSPSPPDDDEPPALETALEEEQEEEQGQGQEQEQAQDEQQEGGWFDAAEGQEAAARTIQVWHLMRQATRILLKCN